MKKEEKLKKVAGGAEFKYCIYCEYSSNNDEDFKKHMKMHNKVWEEQNFRYEKNR